MVDLLLPVLTFVILLIVSYLFRSRFLREGLAPTSAGNILMAMSVFGLAVLPHLPWYITVITPYIALELLVIWLFIVASYIQCYIRNFFYIHYRSMLNRFNIGTWSASCALLAIFLLKLFPTWYEISWPLALLAIVIWIYYLRKAFNDLTRITISRLPLPLNGNILLTVVSTQAIAILINVLWPNEISFLLNLSLILLGVLLYSLCFILLIRSFKRYQLNHIILEWNHSNSLLHGALASIGYAGMMTSILPIMAAIIIWIITLILFIGLEVMSALRWYLRIKKQINFEYDVSQWVRVFSYSLFYAFTAELQPFAYYVQQFKLTNLVNVIINNGQYLILMMVCIEIAIFLRAKMRYHSLRLVKE